MPSRLYMHCRIKHKGIEVHGLTLLVDREKEALKIGGKSSASTFSTSGGRATGPTLIVVNMGDMLGALPVYSGITLLLGAITARAVPPAPGKAI